MNYSLLAWTVVFLSLPSLPSRQVSIDVPREQLNSRETIPAIVANRGKDPVTFCVQFGQTSKASPSGESELTPIPFLVQQYSPGKWGTLMIGPDIGSIRALSRSVPANLSLTHSGSLPTAKFAFCCSIGWATSPISRGSILLSDLPESNQNRFLSLTLTTKNRNSLSPRSGNYTATPHPTYLVAPCCRCYFQAGVEFLRGVSSWLLALMICCAAP